MLKKFEKKKILIFSPEFFGYGKEVAAKLERLGALVHYYDERPGNDFVTKALIRVKKSLLAQKINAYYSGIIDDLPENHYDYVLFLNPEAISARNLELLRKAQIKARFIIYMWDSLKNKKYTSDLLPYFDDKFTFDKEDSTNEAYGFDFRPLFFLDAYKDINEAPQVAPIDLLFIGTLHSDRYSLLMKIKELCKKMNRTVDFYMYFQSRKIYYAQRATNTAFKNADKKEFAFDPISKREIIKKIAKCKAVLDIQHPDQKGLTMRTIEMIGAQKKIITTNHHIKAYDFYDRNNILCIDREHVQLKDAFFTSNYKALPEDIYHKYSINGWLEEVFSIH